MSVDTVATIGTAVGTLALAVATFRLAGRTNELAESGQKAADAATATAAAAEDQVALINDQLEEDRRQSHAAEEALNASVRPVIADVPEGTLSRSRTSLLGVQRRPPRDQPVDVSRISSWIDEAQQLTGIIIPIRNVGPGVARVTQARLALARPTLTDAVRGSLYVRGVFPWVIAPEEVDIVSFGPDGQMREGQLAELLRDDDRGLVVEIVYTDVSGRQETATRLYLLKRGNDSYYVRIAEPLVERQLTRDD